jgi:type II secretory pathway pseudopilin PulG
MEAEVRPPTRKSQFSLLALLVLVAVVAAVCSAIAWLNVSIRDAQRAAHLAAQKRELHDIGASFVAAQEPPHMISEIDFTATGVDQPWLQKRLGYWEYSSVRAIRLRKGQLDGNTLTELRAAFPQVVFTETSPAKPQ